MPLINERYRTKTGRDDTGIGGSSFGGAVTLYAIIERPDLFGRALIESPAVFASDGALVTHLRDFKGPFPERVFIGVGTREVEDADRAATYVNSAEDIAAILEKDGLTDAQLRLNVEPDAIHNESAWARRLPEAMVFLWSR
jgi:predicted alpha/beta superfamily hydrolase